MKRVFFLNIFILFVVVFSQSVLSEERQEPIQVIESTQVLNPAKVELGKKLFFEPRLSKSGFISCNSCHNLATGGVDNLPTSIGHQWQIGPINSPTVFNSKYNVLQFWDGRAADLKEQAKGPIENPKEMASSHELAVQVLNSMEMYQKSFQEIYGEGLIDIDKVADAIAAFEETLVTPNSRFDQWLLGNDDALSQQEQEGYQLFKMKGCIACHMGPAVGASMFQKVGLVHPWETQNDNLGRFNVTQKESDKFVFKVPTLRNIELTAPYFHDAKTWSLAEAVYLMGYHQLGIDLNEEEVQKIVLFLKTLTGEIPQIVYPILPPSSNTTPKPDVN